MSKDNEIMDQGNTADGLGLTPPTEAASEMERNTVTPFLYDTVAFEFSAGASLNGVQAISLTSGDLKVWTKGMGEVSTDSGLGGISDSAVPRDGLFTNLYKSGGFDKSRKFEIHGVGVQFFGSPFVLTDDTAPTTMAGSLIQIDPHAELLANIVLMSYFLQIGGAEEEDCAATIGPLGYYGLSGFGLGDNTATPHMLNNMPGGGRFFRYALFQDPIKTEGVNNFSLTLKKSSKATFGYITNGTTGTIPEIKASGGTINYMMQVVAFGRRV